MIKTVTCFLLVFSLFYANAVKTNAQTSPNANQDENNLDEKSAKIKRDIEKIGQGKDITVSLNDRRVLYGSVKSIEEDLVLIYEVDARKLLEIKYAEIRKVSKGYPEIGINGKRERVSKKSKLLGYAIIFSLIVAMGIGYSKE